MEIEFGAATDTGKVKKNNEDAYICDPELQLFIIADGMGGYAAGDVASQTAIDIIGQEIAAQTEELLQLRAQGEIWEVQARLETAVQRACAELHTKAQETAEYKGMGTTLSMIWMSANRAAIAHVGDSRIYLLRDGRVHRMTEDHSLVQELVRQGRLEKENIANFPYRNAITRALGPQFGVEVDTLDFDLLSGDLFLLCSDGLYRYLQKGELSQFMTSGSEQEIADLLVDLANERGGGDNITAIVLKISEVDSTKEARRKIEIFENMPLFEGFSHKELLTVLNATTMRHYQEGQTIFDENLLGDELFIILSGKVQIQKKSGVVLAQVKVGGHFGEMALVDRNPRSATAVALEPTRLLVLSRRRFYRLLRMESPLAVKLLWNFLQVLSSRLRSTSDELSEAKQDKQVVFDNHFFNDDTLQE